MAQDSWLTSLKETGAVKPRRSLSEEAADNLREFILLGKLAPGTSISETELAEALGISRTPMREALRLLEIEGLVVYSATRRPFVADPSLEELTKYIMVLGALEALAGEIACEQATDAEVSEIIALSAEMELQSQKIDPLEFFRLDMRFHRAIVEASRNEPLIETHRQYNARLWRARFLSSRQLRRRDTTLAQHQAICDALRTRNAHNTAQALREHLKSTITNIASIREQQDATKDQDQT